MFLELAKIFSAGTILEWTWMTQQQIHVYTGDIGIIPISTAATGGTARVKDIA